MYMQWQFLQRDEGEKEPENDPTWLEDDGMCNYSMHVYVYVNMYVMYMYVDYSKRDKCNHLEAL